MAATDRSDATKAPEHHVTHLENPSDALKDAQKAAQAEKDMTLWQALRSNWKAALWSAVISLTIVMEGYDVGEFASR